MRAVVQRVTSASVTVDGEVISRIGSGLCCLIGVELSDGPADIEHLARKICSLRIFDDSDGIMNLDVSEINGDILLVSQFTLLADARKGRRPSYSNAESPDRALPVFDGFVMKMKELYKGRIETGKFQATMDVEIINHGPVTILLDSRKLF